MDGAIGPMGFDFDAMKGKGKGMMPMMMPPEMQMQFAPQFSPQKAGTWQPWGKRHQPPPMILPLKYPEPAPADKGADGTKEADKGKSKGGKGNDKESGDK